MYDFNLIVIKSQLVSKHQSGYKLRSLSYLSRVRIDKRGSEKPISLMVYNDLMVYRKLLKNVREFKKEDCFPVVVKFDMEIT